MTRYSRPNMKEHLNETRAWILYYIVIQTSVDENVAFTKKKQQHGILQAVWLYYNKLFS